MAIWHNPGPGWQILTPTGFPDEATLHTLVEQAPQMLPLAGSPHLTVVGREVLLGNGYADLLALEPTGQVAIVEIKLAKNAEARRAVIGQILGYAAYLQGATFEQFEQVILAHHLQKRGFVNLADAVASEDQENSFDAASFADGVARSLRDGRFRLVIVLDSAPSELVRIATFLESSTDKLVIDLITVSSYDVGGTRLLVPQRVEGEQERAMNDSLPTPHKIAQGKLASGADDFVASIAQAPEEKRPVLEKLAVWADTLEKQGLARLSTYHGTSGMTTLLPRLFVGDVGLVTIYNGASGPLQFWRSVFEKRAPDSIAAVEQITGKNMKQGSTTLAISDELLSVLTEAYRQAAKVIAAK
jgi:hypothetical protein